MLREFVTSKQIGKVFGPNAAIHLGQKAISPDVSVLLALNYGRIRDERVIGPMDLAVEIISPSTRAYDFGRKLAAYREGRVGEIWLIDRDRRQFAVHAWTGEDYVSHVLTTGTWSSLAIAGLEIRLDCLWQDPPPGVLECLRTTAS